MFILEQQPSTVISVAAIDHLPMHDIEIHFVSGIRVNVRYVLIEGNNNELNKAKFTGNFV